MVLLGAVIGVGVYAYHTYVHQEVLKLYMRPVIDMVPGSNGYYLAVINSGHEPIQPMAILYPNGTLSSVDAPTLLEGQYWLVNLTSEPSAVYICSALDPHVCAFVPINNYTEYTPTSTTGASCPITASVSDQPNAGWEITWNYTNNGINYTYTYSGNETENFCVIPPYAPISITFNGTITSSPSGYTCTISPSNTTETYTIGNTQEFTITCNGTVTVSVTNDTTGAGWQVSWTDTQGVVSGSQSGTSNSTWTINNIPYGDSLSFTAQITSNPSGYTCSISPTSTTASPGQSITFTVSCLDTSSSSSSSGSSGSSGSGYCAILNGQLQCYTKP